MGFFNSKPLKLSKSHPEVISLVGELLRLGKPTKQDVADFNRLQRIANIQRLLSDHKHKTGDQVVDVTRDALGITTTHGGNGGEFSLRLLEDGTIQVID